jgi:DNA-binding response OmpR family regulator
MARIEAVVRRHRRGRVREDAGPLVAGELEIRPDRFQIYVAGESVDLTRREFELVQVLAEHAGKVLERDDIYRRVWGYSMIHGDRSVDVFVRKLRSKLQRRSPGWEYIHTHFGVGYRFEPKPLAPDAGEPSVGQRVPTADEAVADETPVPADQRAARPAAG